MGRKQGQTHYRLGLLPVSHMYFYTACSLVTAWPFFEGLRKVGCEGKLQVLTAWSEYLLWIFIDILSENLAENMPGLGFIEILFVFFFFSPVLWAETNVWIALRLQTAVGEIDHSATLGAEDPCFQFTGGNAGFKGWDMFQVKGFNS